MWISSLSPSSRPAAAAVAATRVLAADENGASQAFIDEGERGANDLLLFAFREDDALGLAADAVEDRLHQRRNGIAPRRKLGAIGLHVDDRPARDAQLHRRFRHGRRHDGDKPGIEGRGDQIVATEARTRAPIGAGDLIRHVLARELREGLASRRSSSPC